MKFVVALLALQMFGNIGSVAGATQPALASAPVEKDGLQATVFAGKAVFARNEPIRFTVRFKNVSNKPFSLRDADEFGNWVIRLEHESSRMPWRLQRLAAQQPEASHQPRELKPGEILDVSTDWGSNRFPFQYESQLILNLPIPPVNALPPGRYWLWVGINLKSNLNRETAHTAFKGDINIGPVEIEISDKDDPKGIQASEPVKENNTEFQTLARPQWPVPAAGAKSEVQLGLRVTNRTPTWMQINVFDTVQIVLTDESGKERQCVHERDKTLIPEPLVLTSREGQTIYRNATLERSPDGKSLCLLGSDGAGGNWHFDGLKAGNYRVHFIYENDQKRMGLVMERPGKHGIGSKDAPFWMGKVTTKSLAVEVVQISSDSRTR